MTALTNWPGRCQALRLIGNSRLATVGSAFPAKAPHHIDDKADHQNEAEPAAADGWSTKVKTAAAEQEQEYNNQ